MAHRFKLAESGVNGPVEGLNEDFHKVTFKD
jgi:hypothetical protein